MGLVSDGISSMKDPLIEHSHTFNSPSTLVSGWINKGVGRLRGLFGGVGHTWDCRMINILWQGLIEGGAIIRPSVKALYGDSSLLLAYWMQELLRLGIVVSFPLACSGFTSK